MSSAIDAVNAWMNLRFEDFESKTGLRMSYQLFPFSSIFERLELYVISAGERWPYYLLESERACYQNTQDIHRTDRIFSRCH